MEFEKKPFANIGAVRIYPFARIEGRYNSNVYGLSSRGGDLGKDCSDYAIRAVPGVRVFVPGRTDAFETTYNCIINRYMYFDENSSLGHVVGLKTFFKHNRLTITVNDLFVKDRAIIGNARRTYKYITNTVATLAKIELYKFTFDAKYKYDLYKSWSPSGPSYDTRDHLASFIAYFRAFSKTHLLAQYDRGRITIDSNANRDASYDQYRVGITGEPTAKINATIKAGFHVRDYWRDDIKDWERPILYSNIAYAYSEKTIFLLQAQRRPIESIIYEDFKYTIENSVTLGLNKKLIKHLTGYLEGSYKVTEYPETRGKERSDKAISAEAKVEYEFSKWLKGDVQYFFHSQNTGGGNDTDLCRHEVLIGMTLAL